MACRRRAPPRCRRRRRPASARSSRAGGNWSAAHPRPGSGSRDIKISVSPSGRRQPAHLGRRFQRPHHRRCRRRRHAGRRPARHSPGRTAPGQASGIGVHPVRSQVFAAHRLEGAGDMQRKPTELDAQHLQSRKQRLVEVQTGGRCRNRTGRARVNRLVTLAVQGFVGAHKMAVTACGRVNVRAARSPCARAQIEFVEFVPSAKRRAVTPPSRSSR